MDVAEGFGVRLTAHNVRILFFLLGFTLWSIMSCLCCSKTFQQDHRIDVLGPLIYSYALDLSCPNRKRLEVSKNVKYIAVASRASKLQVSKVGELLDLNLGLPCESLNIRKLTHAGGLG